MKRLVIFVLLATASATAMACDWSRLAKRTPPGIHAKRFPINPRSPFSRSMYKPGLIIMMPRHSVISIQTTLRVQADFRTYTTEFDRGAVFCRMENECLRRYNVKFSIHAGGYRE